MVYIKPNQRDSWSCTVVETGSIRDSIENTHEPPTYCEWCFIQTQRSSKMSLIVRGANYCSKECALARNYEKLRNAAAFLGVFTLLFPIVVLAPYPGNIVPLLTGFTLFYAVFGTGFLILIILIINSLSARRSRPEKSGIGK